MNLSERINEVNNLFFQSFPETRGLRFSGCQYYVNKGQDYVSPANTAQSMFTCEACEIYHACLLKKVKPIWFFNTEVKESLVILARTTKELLGYVDSDD